MCIHRGPEQGAWQQLTRETHTWSSCNSSKLALLQGTSSQNQSRAVTRSKCICTASYTVYGRVGALVVSTCMHAAQQRCLACRSQWLTTSLGSFPTAAGKCNGMPAERPRRNQGVHQVNQHLASTTATQERLCTSHAPSRLQDLRHRPTSGDGVASAHMRACHALHANTRSCLCCFDASHTFLSILQRLL